MKLTASFAILAVLATKTFVAAAPIDNAYDSVLEARAEFVDDALEDVWSRFYDELLEEVEAREYEEELLERAPMKKFVQDLGIGLAQKAPSYAKQYTQSQEAKVRNQNRGPGFANVVKQAQQASKPAARQPLPQIPAASKWNTVKKPSVLAEVKKLGAKKRSLEDIEDYVFQRAPMLKFGKDLATNLAQKAPKMAQQYSQSQQSNNRPQPFSAPAQPAQKKPAQSRPSIPKPPPLPVVKKPSVLAEVKKLTGKKRSLEDIEDYVFQRAPMKKFATDLATNLAQKAPKMAQQYSQSQQSNNRNQQPPRFANVVQQAQQKAGGSSRPSIPQIPAGSKWNTVKKPSVLAEVKKLGKK